MSYKVEVLMKKVDSRGDERIFVSLAIMDDLGRYNYGIWMHPEDFDAVKAEMTPSDFAAWSRLSEFRSLNPNSAALKAFCEEILPAARINQLKNEAEEHVSKAERLAKAQNPSILLEEQRQVLKDELRAEILKEIADGKAK
jgi:hypothetical protein